MKDKTKRVKVNHYVKGQRIRLDVYIDPKDKAPIKELAKEYNMSISKMMQTIVKTCLDNNGVCDLNELKK